jgi:hypothetical protein
MRHTISKRLAPLASLAAQRRFIVQGTRDEYLVPSDLLNDAVDVVRQVRTVPAVRDALPASAVQAFLDLDRLLDAADGAAQHSQSNEQLIEHDAAWRAVRKHVARCLDMMGFDLAEWEKTEGLSHVA